MAKQLQLRRGTTSQHSTFTGANGEVTIDTDKKVVVVHDGDTAGGIPLAKQATVDTKIGKVTSTDNAIVRFDGITGSVQNSGVIIADNNNVGIGTSNPSNKLDVRGNITFGANGVGRLYSDANWGMLHQADRASPVVAEYGFFKSDGTTALFWYDNTNGLIVKQPTGIGYGTGAGGTVTQLTSKSTAVTLNKPTGYITMHNAALAAGAFVSFNVNNSLVTSYDNVDITFYGNVPSVQEKYSIEKTVVNGAFAVTLKNLTAGSLSEAVTFNFTLTKGANS